MSDSELKKKTEYKALTIGDYLLPEYFDSFLVLVTGHFKDGQLALIQVKLLGEFVIQLFKYINIKSTKVLHEKK